MTFAEKAQFFIILAAVLAGLVLGSLPWAQQHATRLIVPLWMLMLTGVFLHVPLKGFAGAFQYRSVAFTSLGINLIWTPFLPWLLGWLFLAEHPALQVGFLMLMVPPCTDWCLVFTGIARGNLAVSTALLPVNLLLQLLLLPVFIFLLAGTVFTLDWVLVLESVFLVLLIPFLAANIFRHLVVRFKTRAWLEGRLLPVVSPAQIILLALAIMALFASEGNAVAQNPQMLLYLLPPLALFLPATCCSPLL